MIAFFAYMSGVCLLLASANAENCHPAKVPDWQWFRNSTIQHTASFKNGVAVRHWPTMYSGVVDGGMLLPPVMNRIEIPPGQTFPEENKSYWLNRRSSYVVTQGQAAIAMYNGTILHLKSGDHFSSSAGALHGPITNTGSSSLWILAKALLEPRFTSPPTILPPQDLAWPTQAATFYDDAPAGHTPLPAIYKCGEVKVSADNGLLVGIDSLFYPNDCDFPLHEHPTGALYFVTRGLMTVIGDQGPTESQSFGPGEGRWVRPGFAYREHFAAGTQFLVQGVPPLPIVGGAPPGATLVVRRQDILEVSYENSQNATMSQSLDLNVV